jgi:acetyl-CoA carboxylase biotin carboxyl carrier protein
VFTFDQVKELMDLVAERGLGMLEVERAGYRLKIAGRASSPSVPAPPTASAPAAPPAPQALPAAPATDGEGGAEAEQSSDTHLLRSPIVGTFYVATSPDADPYVRIGDRVKRGQIVCIVEAMKLMNEIEADVDGTIRSVLAENGQPVEYGEPLFAIEVA